MSLLADTKIGTKLSLSYVLILIFLITISALSIIQLKSQSDSTREFINNDVSQLELAHEIYTLAQESTLKLLQILSTQTREERVPLYKEMDQKNAKLNQLVLKFKNQNTKGEMVDQIIAAKQAYEEAFQSTVEYVEYDREVAFDDYTDNTQPKLNQLLDRIQKFVILEREILHTQQHNSEIKSQEAATIVILLSISIIFLMIILAVLITRSIVQPLRDSVTLAKEIAAGNIEQSHTVLRKDELGDLCLALNQMTENLQKLFTELEESRDQALIATEVKSQFLATISHEIRTPMNGVIGMAQLLEGTPLTLEQKDYLDAIMRSGNGLLSIINNVLDFTKLEVEKVDIEHITFDLEQLCQDCLELVSGNVDDSSVEFILDYDPDCPRHFKGDPSRVRQILLNLMSNASKFTKEGFVRCAVSMIPIEEFGYTSNRVISDDGQHLLIEVEDTGIGIEESAQSILFEEFSQADTSTTRKYGGTGLGLAITKKLVELMNGEIGIRSIVSEGSTFWIRDILEISDSPKTIARSSLKDIRILLVDDNPINLRVFSRMIKHMGAEITILDDATKVIETLDGTTNENKFDIVILDHQMPVLNGYELGLEIRDNPTFDYLKLLVISSIGQKGDATLFAKAGFDAYLNKLCRYDVLKTILECILNHETGSEIITQHSVKESQVNQEDDNLSFEANILVVEDNKTNQIIATKFLEKLGINVDIAINGQEAINSYELKHYDLIFMDCRMPVLDGYEACKSIRQIEEKNQAPRIPIIALTANASKSDRELCKKSGMDDIVTKPFKRADLSSVLKTWLTN